jgi:hypothetical protein
MKKAGSYAAHLLAAAGHSHSMRWNECMDAVYFFTQDIVTNTRIIAEVVYIQFFIHHC